MNTNMKDSLTVSLKASCVQNVGRAGDASKQVEISNKESKTNVKSLKNFYNASNNDDELSFEALPVLKNILLYLRSGDHLGFHVDHDLEIISIDKSGPAYDILKIGYVIRTVNKILVNSYEQFMGMFEQPGLYNITTQKESQVLPRKYALDVVQFPAFRYKEYKIMNTENHRNIDLKIVKVAEKFYVKQVPEGSIFEKYLVRCDCILSIGVNISKMSASNMLSSIISSLIEDRKNVTLVVKRPTDEFYMQQINTLLKEKRLNCCLQTLAKLTKRKKTAEVDIRLAGAIEEIELPFVYYGLEAFEVDKLLLKNGDYLVVIMFEDDTVLFMFNLYYKNSTILIRTSKNQVGKFVLKMNEVEIVTKDLKTLATYLLEDVLKLDVTPMPIKDDDDEA